MNLILLAIALISILITLYLFYLDKTHERKVNLPLFERIYDDGSAEMTAFVRPWYLFISETKVPSKVYKNKSFKIEIDLKLEEKHEIEKDNIKGVDLNDLPVFNTAWGCTFSNGTIEFDDGEQEEFIETILVDYYLDVDVKCPSIEMQEIKPSRSKFGKDNYTFSWVAHFSESGEYLLYIIYKIVDAADHIRFSKETEYKINVVTLDGLTVIQLRNVKYVGAFLTFLMALLGFLNVVFKFWG